MKTYPIVGNPRLDEALSYLEARTGEGLSLLNLFRLAHAGELQLVIFMNNASSDSFYYCPSVDSDFYSEEDGFYSSASFTQALVENCEENEEFFDAVENEYLEDDGLSARELDIKWGFKDRPIDNDLYYLPLRVISGDAQFLKMQPHGEISAKRVLALGVFEDRFGVTSESLNALILKCNSVAKEGGKQKLSTQGENAYKKTCRALAQALIGTLPEAITAREIRDIERELADRGVENPHSSKTWIKHLSSPD